MAYINNLSKGDNVHNVVVTTDMVDDTINEMTLTENRELVKVALEFKAATNYEVAEVLDIMTQLHNKDVGISNKVLCAGRNLNHWNVIAFMVKKGWLTEDNYLTELGFREMNDAYGVSSVNIDEDKLLLQNYNGSLYWNKHHENFETIIKEIEEGVKEGNYNEQLKQTLPPISPQTKKLLLSIPTMMVLRSDGTKVVR